MRQLLPLGILALAVIGSLACRATGSPAAAPEPPRPSVLVEQKTPAHSPSNDPGRPELKQTVSGPAECILPPSSRTQRAELRQPGLKSWLGCPGCKPNLEPTAWWTRPGIARSAPQRPRLHVLLCTWLN
jgi:hypothetical protein